MIGEIRYFPHPNEVEPVKVIELGDGGRIHRRPIEEPVLVESSNGDRWVAPRAMLFVDEVAACTESVRFGLGA